MSAGFRCVPALKGLIEVTDWFRVDTLFQRPKFAVD